MSDIQVFNRSMVTRSFIRTVNGASVESTVSYIAVKEGTLWDAELIAWAEARATRLKQMRAVT